MKRAVFIFLFVALSLIPLAAESDDEAILREMDRITSFMDSDFSCEMTVVTEKPGEEMNVRQARIYRRDAAESAVILIEKPPVQKGQGYLMVGESLWFYDPESRKFAHTSVKDNFQDSDAKNSDFRPPNYSSDYRAVARSEGILGDFAVWILDLEAVSDAVPYPGMKIWVRKDIALLLKAENYGLSGRLMRTSYYPQYRKVGATYIASKMLFVDELRPGEKTQITIKEPSLAPIPDELFTKSFIERVSR